MHNPTKHRLSGLKRLFIFILPAVFAVGCHAYVLDDAQMDIRSGFASGDFEKTQKQLEKLREKSVYRSKDDVLYNLESGMVSHFAGNYSASIEYFTKAEKEIEDNFTKSISRGIGAFLLSDNTLVYDGEPYEDIYINAFNSLNFIHLGELDKALVEARRMAFKMEQLDIRLKGLADAFAKSDTTSKIDWKQGELNIQNSAFSHYLAMILYAKAGKRDDARIEYEKLRNAYREQNALEDFTHRELPDFGYLIDPNRYNVLLAGFTGQAPYKIQEDARIFSTSVEDGVGEFYMKASFPVIELYSSEIYRVQAVLDDGTKIPLHLIEEMDLVAKNVYKSKQPIIYSRALLRALFKSISTSTIKSALSDDYPILSEIFGLFGVLTSELSEKADLRGWQTLPGSAWLHAINLPVGEHGLSMEYLDHRGRVLFKENFIVNIENNSKLMLIESIYSR